MKTDMKREWIISLLMDDLIHNKLIDGLIASGLNSEIYCIDNASLAISMMGFKGDDNEWAYKQYLKRQAQTRFLVLPDDREEFRKLAMEFYEEFSLVGPVLVKYLA